MMDKTFYITVFGDICPMYGKIPVSFPFLDDEYVVGNLECVLTDDPRPVRKAGPVLYAPQSAACELRALGFSALSLANNHIRDCGEAGVKTTLAACRQSGIWTFGAGTTDDAATPLVVEQNGIRVALLSFAEKEFNYAHAGKAGAHAFDPYGSFGEIASLRKEVDALIVLYHGGIEHYIYPSPLLRKKCRMMVDAGADVVLCQHSHCIGTRERYRSSEILYGQGNSVFGYRSGKDGWNQGLVARITVTPQTVQVRYDVLETGTDGVVGLAPEETARIILDRLESASSKLSDEAFLEEQWKAFCLKNEASYLAMLLGFSKNGTRLNRLSRNGLVKAFYNRRQLNVAHNIIRCEAHAEVLDTILQEYDYE